MALNKCTFFLVYNNLRYLKDGLFKGIVVSGHDFVYTGEVHKDHWKMGCLRCQKEACIAVAPERAKND